MRHKSFILLLVLAMLLVAACKEGEYAGTSVDNIGTSGGKTVNSYLLPYGDQGGMRIVYSAARSKEEIDQNYIQVLGIDSAQNYVFYETSTVSSTQAQWVGADTLVLVDPQSGNEIKVNLTPK